MPLNFLKFKSSRTFMYIHFEIYLCFGKKVTSRITYSPPPLENVVLVIQQWEYSFLVCEWIHIVEMVLKSPFLNLCSSADGYDKVSNNGAPPVPKTYEFQNGQRVVKKVRLLSPWVLAPRDFQSESLQLRSNLPKNHFFIDIRATTLKK